MYRFPGIGRRLDGTTVPTSLEVFAGPAARPVAEVLLHHEQPMQLLDEVKKLHTCTAAWLYDGRLDRDTSQQVHTLLLELTMVISKMELQADVLPYHTECEMLSQRYHRLHTTIAATLLGEPVASQETILDDDSSDEEEGWAELLNGDMEDPVKYNEDVSVWRADPVKTEPMADLVKTELGADVVKTEPADVVMAEPAVAKKRKYAKPKPKPKPAVKATRNTNKKKGRAIVPEQFIDYEADIAEDIW